MRFALWPIAHRFAAGHRIRLQVSSGAHPRYARNPGTGEDPATATAATLRAVDIELLRDAEHPSRLVLPGSADRLPALGYSVRMLYAPRARHLLRARDLADARYADPLGVDDMAAAAGLSRAHFSREFRRAFGVSPHVYLLTRRLERAAALLRNTDRSVADICFSVGLQSLGSFTSSFTRTYGVSPTAYRADLPAGRRTGRRAQLHRARLRPSATQHISRRQRSGRRLACSASVHSHPVRRRK